MSSEKQTDDRWIKSVLPRAKQTAKRVDEAKQRLPVIHRLPLRRIGLIGGLIVGLTVLLWPDLPFVRHEYKIGETVGRDILADRNYRIVDKAATTELRHQAALRARAVFDYDQSAARRALLALKKTLVPLEQFFIQARRNYESALSTRAWSQAGGRLLLQVRTRPRRPWPPLLFGLADDLFRARLADLNRTAPHQEADGDRILAWVMSRPDLKKKLTGLEQAFERNLVPGLTLDLPTRSWVGLRRAGYPSRIRNQVAALVGVELGRGVVGHRSILSRERPKGIILRYLPSRTEQVVKDVGRLTDLRQAYRRINLQYRALSRRFTPDIAEAIILMARSLLRPNVTINTAETIDRRDKAMRTVKPRIIKIFRGDVIISRGEKITPADWVKLEAMRNANPLGKTLFVTLGLILLLLTLFYTTYRVGGRQLGTTGLHLPDLALMVVTILLVAVMARGVGFLASELPKDVLPINPSSFPWLAPMAFGGIIVSVFMGIGAAVLFGVCVAVVGAWVMPQQLYYFLFVLVGSLAGAMAVHQGRGRTRFLLAGAVTGGANVLVVAGQLLIQDSFFHFQGLIALAFAFSGGLLAGVLASGLVPLAEVLLGYTTEVKLQDLASLDRPALRELMVQAPGTYHHSIVVGNLVEAAAKEIGANPMLAKAAAYYHDIGKIKKPLYFVENQTNGFNRHEKLAPSLSALILISHVKDGVELAKSYGLGREIADIIAQHHGTNVIKYFYQKALDRSEKGQRSEVNIENFRYPGPKPQTKEAGLVLLADAVEAAGKTLVDPTPSRVKGMVQKIINTIFSDGQLDECELTLKDLHNIARNFNQVLAGMFHQRIEYPEPVDKGGPGRRKGNGDLHQRSANGGSDQSSGPEPADQENLKRLGGD
jgi:putative nucleotidyltransferase with HDIG domain